MMVAKRFVAVAHIFFIVVHFTTKSEGSAKNELKRLSTTISDVRELIRGGYVYVDKTGYALRLIYDPNSYFVLVRPRRFGKTTFLSTLAEVFEGNKDLFNGTAIHRSEYTWPKRPILRFDFSDPKIACESAEIFNTSLTNLLKAVASTYQIEDLEGETVGEKVADLITALYDKLGSRLVILVDEYDHPHASNRQNPEMESEIIEIMRSFYTGIYSVSSSVEMCFVTGVTKLSRAGFYPWCDISRDGYYAEIAGFTQEELEYYFPGHIENVVKHKNTTRENVMEELKTRYEGYKFSVNRLALYNPFTVISYFMAKESRNFWTQLESPSVYGLAEQIAVYPDSAIAYLHGKRSRPSLHVLTNNFDKELDEEGLNMLETHLLPSGYLTIKKYDPKRELFKLGLANQEIREAFFNALLVAFGEEKYNELHQVVYGLNENLQSVDLNEFVGKMNLYIATFLANATTESDKLSMKLLRKGHLTNKIFKVIFESGLMIAGLKVDPELPEDKHEANHLLTLSLAHIFYLFELRLDVDPTEECIKQYKKRYLQRNNSTGKEAICVGVKFDTKTARIVDWMAAVFSETGEELRRMCSLD